MHTPRCPRLSSGATAPHATSALSAPPLPACHQRRPGALRARAESERGHDASTPARGAASQEKKVVVVGGGWAGALLLWAWLEGLSKETVASFGAAKHLAEQGYKVTVVDAALNAGGLSAGWRTPQGRAVEAGIKGFWYQYHNIFRLVEELGIENPFTAWTPSGFWSPQGLVTESPVFSEKPRLPTMLGQFYWTLPLFYKLSLADRASMVPLLAAVLDFDASPATYARYDQLTALELFRRYGVTEGLLQGFLRPLLLVGLFAPPEQLSAAAVLGTFYYYALGHQADFDVCWCRGSVAERILDPLLERIRGAGGDLLGGRLVSDVHLSQDGRRVVGVTSRTKEGQETRHDADAVVFAVGISGMQKLVGACPALLQLPEFRATLNLRSIDCIAVRLWFDGRVTTRFPSNVLSGFEAATGGTFFNLNELQDEYKGEPGSVIAADFYGATELLPLTDEAIVRRVHSHITLCEPGFAGVKVVDAAVLRFPRAVTHFSPGSYPSRPLQTTSLPNLFVAGDWVKGVPHGANGLSQERAYVTGLRAANLVVGALGRGRPCEILPVEPDEGYVALGKGLARGVRGLEERLGLRLPFTV